ncbi:MAG TPA: hypothetical protein VES38_06890 [Methylotenera sp.]|nr:hypothetical protein [Methylotenera sp.]
MSLILDHLVEDHGFTLDEAKFSLIGWELRPMMQDKRQVGEIMIQNNEAHFALDKSFRKRMGRGKLFGRLLDDLLSEKGFIVTKLFINDKMKALIELMGFRKIRTDGEFDYFWLDEETRHARN